LTNASNLAVVSDRSAPFIPLVNAVAFRPTVIV